MENIVENNILEKRNLIINQIKLQNKIQSLGINLVNCGNCGSIFFHECDDNDTVKCPFCYRKMAKSDCPDYFYEGLELSGEFDFNNQIETITENPAFFAYRTAACALTKVRPFSISQSAALEIPSFFAIFT